MEAKFAYVVDDQTIKEEVRLIGPEEATTILKSQNSKNRKPNPNHVRALALNMTNGSWRYNGDPIRFDSNGVLIDGQHRLMAVELVKKPILFKIMHGLNPECFKVIDVEAKSRSLSDVFKIARIPNASVCSSIINRYFTFSHGYSAISSANGTSNGTSGRATKQLSTKVTTDQKYDFYWKHVKLVLKTIDKAHQYYSMYRILTPSDIGGLFLYLHLDKGHDFEVVDEFFRQLYSFSNLNAINRLRVVLINDLTATKKMTGQHRQIYIAKAWNYYIKERDVKNLKINIDKDKDITFI